MNVKLLPPVCILFALALTSTAAQAECFQTRASYKFRGDTITDYDTIVGGSSCRHPNRPGSATRYTSLLVISPAKNGQVSVSGFSATYTPKPGFKGADQYALKLCGGKGRNPRGCSTINVVVAVQ